MFAHGAGAGGAGPGTYITFHFSHRNVKQAQ